MDTAFQATLERAFRQGLKLGHLRVLTTLARVGTVSRVAEIFNVTQPAISKQLGELEALLGTPVVSRVGRSVTLTPTGEILMRYGRQILYNLESARREIEDLHEGLVGTLRIGSVPTTISTQVSSGIARLRQRAPGITIILREATTDTLFPLVRDGEIDIVISRTRIERGALVSNALEERLIDKDPMVIVCNDQHPLAGRKSLKWSDFSSYTWILPPEGSAIHDGLTHLFEKHSLHGGAGSITSNSITALPALLKDSNLVGVLPRTYAQDLVSRQLLVILPVAFSSAAQEVRAVWRHENESPTLRLFLQSLSEVLKF